MNMAPGLPTNGPMNEDLCEQLWRGDNVKHATLGQLVVLTYNMT